jgi:RNA polymerase sigma-70 factor, ECF subfamily
MIWRADTAVPAPRPSVLPWAAYPDWEAIYADNVSRVYRLMFAKVGNRPDAEDLTSQVFLAAYGSLRTSRSVGEVQAYLLVTARTMLAEHWRRTLGHQVTEVALEQDRLQEFAGPARQEAERPSDAPDRIAGILGALPDRHRTILTLRFLRGYTIKQAAAELGVSVANAKVLQHRALRRAAGLKPQQEQEQGQEQERGQERQQGPEQEQEQGREGEAS